MKLTADIEIIEDLPIAYIKSLDALVCSDIHLGYEGVMADKGTFLPKVNLNNIKELLKRAVKTRKASKIIVDGDIKNKFSTVHVEEFNEFYEFIHFLKDELKIPEIILIKGNHDNFIDRLEKPLGVKLHRQEAVIGNYLFFHGEELPQSKEEKILIMGHLHPAVVIYNNLGVKEKLKCFLYGSLKDKRKIVILPAMNYFAEGAEVNTGKIDDHAPILEQMLDIKEMEAICIGDGEALNFGKIKQLQAIL